MSIPNHLGHNDKGSSSLQDLNEDLDLIYQSYMKNHGNDSNDTLDSQTHQVISNRRFIPNEVVARFNQNNGNYSSDSLENLTNHQANNKSSDLPVHISSRLSSLKNGRDAIQSAPQTPNSNSSFDFNPHNHTYAMSNGSFNILDSSNIEKDFKDMMLSPKDRVGSSTDALKSVIINEDNSINNEADDEGYTGKNGTNYDDDYDNDYSNESNKIDENHVLDKDNDDKDYVPPTTDPNDEWGNKGAATKIINGESGYKVIRRSVQDFAFGKQLGEGSYSTVVLATDKVTSTKYAVKILDKRHIIKEKKVKYVNIEKHALNRLSNRMGIISLYFTFQDKDSLYFVLDYASKGELLSLIKQYNTLNEDCTRYFASQILDAIKFMHNNGVIHRDIKPENILLDENYRIQITDFGTARLLEKKKNDESEEYPVDVRAKSFVGTAEYVSPELLENKYCGKPGDIWAFGCIVYQMIAGKPPFKAANEYLTFQKITKLQYAFSAGFPIIIRDLIKQILVLQPSKRASIATIQDHYFFNDIDFDDFDSIWLASPPEMGPYKMSAKSMMKVPELNKSPSTQSVNIKRNITTPKTNGKRIASEPGSATSHSNANTHSTPTSAATTNKNDGKFVNPASVAAFVLNKKESSPEVEDIDDREESLTKTTSRASDNHHTPPTSSSSHRIPQPEYIPGTNILRPTINSLHSYSRSSSNVKKKSIKSKPKTKTLEVTPITPLEIAWQQYLSHPEERILKIGPVIANKITTELFEKKYKGLIHDSPLGFQNKGRQNSSFLSQVVNGNSGLRGSNMGNNQSNSLVGADDDIICEDGDESDAVIDYFVIEEAPSMSNESTDSNSNTNKENNGTSGSSRGSKFLKRFGISNALSSTLSGKEKANDKNESTTQHPLEKSRTCTMVITTHGRVLIFFRNDPEANYRLISEITLSYSFINFKEVVSSANGKLSRLLPTTGLFAIVSKESTFTFEVEKYEINGWTESLAKAQINQMERLKLDKLDKVQKSPKLMESPDFSVDHKSKEIKNNHKDKHSRDSKERERTQRDRGRDSTKKSEVSDSKSPKSREHHEGLLTNKLKNRSSIKRKPPPQVPIHHGVDMSTGLSQENGMLAAAQLAVSNNSHSVPTNNRRSSFSKDEKPHSNYKVVKSPNASGGITQMNSKFLARSQRKK